jgi:hypothetical protein
MDKYDYLNGEREKLWERLIELEKLIDKKSSDYEKEAKQSSKKASEFKNRISDAKDLALENAELAKSKAEQAKQLLTNIKILKTKSEDYANKIAEFATDLEGRKDVIEENIEVLEENFGNNASFITKLETLDKNFEQGSETINKIEILHKSIQPKKKEIDNVYREIFGYTETETDKAGAETEIKIAGLKEELEGSYIVISKELEGFSKDIANTKKEILNNYSAFVTEKETAYKTIVENWKKEHQSVLEKINKLLPNALTAGLSYAYSEKKDSEIIESIKFAQTFRYAAFGLTAMSLIPFILSIVFLVDGKSLIQVIEYSPRLVLSIIPMYIPILWIAYSSNKKMNLSKRLVEEYTHKEVLSKTFEGLSYQINNIEDEEASADLKIRLLYNILSVSSENPGKLISDYNKSDHPLMDALDKSAILSDAVEKLENIPGLSKITRILDRKSKHILKQQADKVNVTLGEIVDETLSDIPE